MLYLENYALISKPYCYKKNPSEILWRDNLPLALFKIKFTSSNFRKENGFWNGILK